ncbi:hypothetical protein Gotur_021109, partial [Gossypium turneri]
MIQRQFASRQFVPVTDGLAQSEFAITGEDNDIWRQQRVKIQLTPPIDDACQNSFSEEISSELEMARHEFEREKVKLLLDISSLQEENYQLKIDVQIEKSKTSKLRKNNVEYETVSAELTAIQSEHQELKGKIRSLESTLQAHQQHLDDLLRALEEKNGQQDRDIRTYEKALQEKDMHLGSLINESCKAAV